MFMSHLEYTLSGEFSDSYTVVVVVDVSCFQIPPPPHKFEECTNFKLLVNKLDGILRNIARTQMLQILCLLKLVQKIYYQLKNSSMKGGRGGRVPES